jgi:pentose-5-phosphate-3-epimerase
MEVVPTITTTAIDTFEYLMFRFLPHGKTFQIDIQDGHFVPNKTFTADDVLQFLQNLPPERLDIYKSAVFDFHLMVQGYGPSLEAISQIKRLVTVRYIFVHQNFPLPSHANIENWSLKIEHLSVCPTLNPEDPPVQGATFLGKPLLSFPAIQIMTIHPGPQGQAFIPKQLERINELRMSGYKGKIVVDGSMNPTSLQYILSRPSIYHPDIACIGSYLSRAPDKEIGARIETLKALVA